MADNLAMKLLIAGIVGAVVGAATADRYRFPAGSVYGFKNQSESGQSRTPTNPVIASARAGEARTGDSASPPRVMRTAPPDRPEVGPSGSPPSRGAKPSAGYRPVAMCWREYDDPDFGPTSYFVRCAGRSHRPRGQWASYPP